MIGSLKNSDFELSSVIEDDLRSVTVRSCNRLRADFNQIVSKSECVLLLDILYSIRMRNERSAKHHFS